jgi:hypothetical protein
MRINSKVFDDADVHRLRGPTTTDHRCACRCCARGEAGGRHAVHTGRAVDLDLRGSDAEILARLPQDTSSDLPVEAPASEPRGRGRPKLGVVAREVTLLPRHWEWLNAQPGGASVALRKLVDEARRANGDKDRAREAREAAYHFMSAAAGNRPHFEEASRALFADDRRHFVALIADWPADIRDHAVALAFRDRAD